MSPNLYGSIFFFNFTPLVMMDGFIFISPHPPKKEKKIFILSADLSYSAANNFLFRRRFFRISLPQLRQIVVNDNPLPDKAVVFFRLIQQYNRYEQRDCHTFSSLFSSLCTVATFNYCQLQSVLGFR